MENTGGVVMFFWDNNNVFCSLRCISRRKKRKGINYINTVSD